MGKTIKLIVFSALVFIGCESIIDVSVPYYTPKLTINSYLNPDSTILLSLTESRSILDDNPYVPVDSARIILYENDQDMGKVEMTGNGWYTIKRNPRTGRRYSLKVETSRFGVVEAETYIPARVRISNITISDQRVQRDYEQYHTIDLKIDDPVDPGNLYEIILWASVNERLYRNDTLIEQEVYQYNVDLAFEDKALEEQNTFGGSSSLIFNDLTFNGSSASLKILAKSRDLNELQRIDGTYFSDNNKFRIIKNDFLYLVLRHTTDSYHYFKKSLNLQVRNKGNPFAEPVKVFSNIENGHGIFTGYSERRYQIDLAALGGSDK